MSLDITYDFHVPGQNSIKDAEKDCNCGCKGKCGKKRKDMNYEVGAVATPAFPNTVCPDDLAPVCGVNDNSYKNICFLNKMGIQKAYDGWCQKDLAKGLKNPATPVVVNPTPQPCPTTVDPVCSVDFITYPNACLAVSAGRTIRHQGACTGQTSPGSQEVACPTIYDPVCSTEGLNYPNECTLKAAGKTMKQKGLCALTTTPPPGSIPVTPTPGGGILDGLNLPEFSQTTWLLIAAGAFLLLSGGGVTTGGRRR